MEPSFLLYILISLGITVLGLTVYLIHHYTSPKHVSIIVYLTVIIGWYTSFSVIILLPFDIMVIKGCEEANISILDCTSSPFYSLLITVWNSLYWTTFFLTWGIVPILQVYSTAGEFTLFGRIKKAISVNILFYIGAGIAFMIFLFYISISAQLSGEALQGFAIALSNAWGLFVAISLLGYGLVEIPRYLWYKSDYESWLSHYQYKATVLDDDINDVTIEFQSTMSKLKWVDENCSQHNALRLYVDSMIAKVPKNLYKAARARTSDFNGIIPVIDMKNLVVLHSDIKFALIKLKRAQRLWDGFLEDVFELEDRIKNIDAPDQLFKSTLRPSPSKSSWSMSLAKLEWTWKCLIWPIALRVLAILFTVFSLMVVWTEVLFWRPEPDLSLFSAFVHKASPTLRLLFVLTSVGYICGCAYWSLLQVKLFNYYQLTNTQFNDENSLLFSAAYLARLATPLCYNFILAARLEHTAFQRVIGQMDIVPFFGVAYNVYFPVFIFLFCFFTFFNLYSKILRCLGQDKFIFESNVEDDEYISHGKKLISKARQFAEKKVLRARRVNAYLNERSALLTSDSSSFPPSRYSSELEEISPTARASKWTTSASNSPRSEADSNSKTRKSNSSKSSFRNKIRSLITPRSSHDGDDGDEYDEEAALQGSVLANTPRKSKSSKSSRMKSLFSKKKKEGKSSGKAINLTLKDGDLDDEKLFIKIGNCENEKIDSAIESLLETIDKFSDFYVHPAVRLVSSPTAGLHFIASQDILSSGELLMSVPFTWAFNAYTLAGDKSSTEYNAQIRQLFDLFRQEREKGEESIYNSWFSLIPRVPRDLSLPWSFDQQLLDRIAGSFIKTGLKLTKESIDANAPEDASLLQDWYYFYTLYHSRAFPAGGIKIKGGGQAAGERLPSFIPFMDFLNHNQSSPNAAYHADLESASYKVESLTPIAAGEEIFVSYGADLSPTKLITDYGFYASFQDVDPEIDLYISTHVDEPVEFKKVRGRYLPYVLRKLPPSSILRIDMKEVLIPFATKTWASSTETFLTSPLVCFFRLLGTNSARLLKDPASANLETLAQPLSPKSELRALSLLYEWAHLHLTNTLTPLTQALDPSASAQESLLAELIHQEISVMKSIVEHATKAKEQAQLVYDEKQSEKRRRKKHELEE